MKKYNIKQVTKLIDVNSHTLRYYDNIGLCKPHRTSNNYRYYTDEDLNVLKYIKVLKYGGLSLCEIGVVLKNKQMLKSSNSNLESTKAIIASHKNDLVAKINHYQQIVGIINVSEQILANNICKDKSEIEKLVDETFNAISQEQEY